MLRRVKKLHQEGRLNLLADKDLKGNFDQLELEEMVQVALLSTQFNPSHRPKMSEIQRMLEGDGLAEKWEASQNIETPRYIRSYENPPQRYSDFIEESSLVVEAMELPTMTKPNFLCFFFPFTVFHSIQLLWCHLGAKKL